MQLDGFTLSHHEGFPFRGEGMRLLDHTARFISAGDGIVTSLEIDPGNPPPSAQNLPNSRGGVSWVTRSGPDFLAILDYFCTDLRSKIAKIFARLRRDFSPYRVLKSKNFARLRRDFSHYRVLKSKNFRSRLRRDDES